MEKLFSKTVLINWDRLSRIAWPHLMLLILPRNFVFLDQVDRLLSQKRFVNVGNDTTTSDCCFDQRIQFFVTSNSLVGWVNHKTVDKITSCKWRGVMRFTRKSFEAFPANSKTSAVKYSRMAAEYTAALAPTRMWWVARFLSRRCKRPTGNYNSQWKVAGEQHAVTHLEASPCRSWYCFFTSLRTISLQHSFSQTSKIVATHIDFSLNNCLM